MSPARASARSTITIISSVRAGVSPASVRAWVARAWKYLRLPAGEISVVWQGPAAMAKLNQRYRRHHGPTNVLSFRYDQPRDGRLSAEIFLCPPIIRREAPRFQHTYRQHCRFLLEHGLIHLRGIDHQTPTEQRRWSAWERQLHA